MFPLQSESWLWVQTKLVGDFNPVDIRQIASFPEVEVKNATKSLKPVVFGLASATRFFSLAGPSTKIIQNPSGAGLLIFGRVYMGNIFPENGERNQWFGSSAQMVQYISNWFHIIIHLHNVPQHLQVGVAVLKTLRHWWIDTLYRNHVRHLDLKVLATRSFTLSSLGTTLLLQGKGLFALLFWVVKPYFSTSLTYVPGWWFQPISKILVKMGIFP